MNPAMLHYIASAKDMASHRSLAWDPPHDARGEISQEQRWNLSRLVGLPMKSVLLSDFGWNQGELEILNITLEEKGLTRLTDRVMPSAWRDFYQAAILTHLLVGRNKPGSTYYRGRVVKTLAMCAPRTDPSDVTGDQVQAAYNVVLRNGEATNAGPFVAMIREIDGLHLANRANLSAFCKPDPGLLSQKGQKRLLERVRKGGDNRRNRSRILGTLHERKDVLNLPDTAAFWEFCRIVFTEEPRSVHDLQLFACGRVHILAGLRAGEVALLPLDWERWQEWTDIDGTPAGERGGISRSLSIRHFAEKQQSDEGREGLVLVPRRQHVAAMFEDVVLDTFQEVERVTHPMRETLKRQSETGRLLPDYDPTDLVPAWELFVRLSGDVRVSRGPIPDELVEKYLRGVVGLNGRRRRFDSVVHDEILARQTAALASRDALASRGASGRQLCAHLSNTSRALLAFFGPEPYPARDAHGTLLPGDGMGRLNWNKAHFLVSEVEQTLARWDEYRLPDRTPHKLADGTLLHPHEMLFLTPKFVVPENLPFTHLGKIFRIRRFRQSELQDVLGGLEKTKHLSIFARYGRTAESRKLVFNTHSARHLQNTELKRLGVSDAILTKRFNRSSVQQTQGYDHRSLQEHLDGIAVSEEVEQKLGPRATQTYKLIASGRVGGPLVDEFLRIQREMGDDDAFEYLATEADGLHVTPYGLCVNAFTVDPCPKHLECFNGCRHLARSERPEEQQELERLRDRMTAAVAKIEAEPENRPGRANQLRHARIRLGNIENAVAARPGTKPFPDGPDLYKSAESTLGTTVLDGPKFALEAPDDVAGKSDATPPRRPVLDMDDA